MHLFRVIFIIAVSFSQIAHAQDDSLSAKRNYPAIAVGYGYGKIFPTNSFVKGDNQIGKPMDNFQSLSLKLLRQNPGYTDWQRIHNIPYYGVGLSVGDLFNPDEIGYFILWGTGHSHQAMGKT